MTVYAVPTFRFAAAIVQTAEPADRVTVLPLSQLTFFAPVTVKVTVPVGTPLPGPMGATVAVTMAGCPATGGSALAVTVTTVESAVTVSPSGPLVDPESPFFYIPPYISAVLRGEEPRPLHAGDGGDSCYAPDAGRAIALLTTTPTLRHDTYNVSSGRPFTNREFADALQAVVPGLRLDLLPGRQDGPGDDPYLDITRLTGDTGFTPAFDVAAAVADYATWRAGNPR